MLKKFFESNSSPGDDHDPDPSRQDLDSRPVPEEVTDLPPITDEEITPLPPPEEEGIPDPIPEADVIPDPVPEPDLISAASQEKDVDSVRALILQLHPAIVPELIIGDSVSALIASIVPAQEAYNRIVAYAPDVRIPAGGNPPIALDVDSLTSFDKIRRGLTNAHSVASGIVPSARTHQKA